MVVASGIVKVNRNFNVQKIAGELMKRGMEVDDLETEHIIFVIRKETLDDVKKEIDSMKNITDVRSVYITYYSLEGNENELPVEGNAGKEEQT